MINQKEDERAEQEKKEEAIFALNEQIRELEKKKKEVKSGLLRISGTSMRRSGRPPKGAADAPALGSIPKMSAFGMDRFRKRIADSDEEDGEWLHEFDDDADKAEDYELTKHIDELESDLSGSSPTEFDKIARLVEEDQKERKIREMVDLEVRKRMN